MDYLLPPPAIRANMMSPACQVIASIIVINTITIVITIGIIIIVITIAVDKSIIIVIVIITILSLPLPRPSLIPGPGVSNSDIMPIPNRVFDRSTQNAKYKISRNFKSNPILTFHNRNGEHRSCSMCSLSQHCQWQDLPHWVVGIFNININMMINTTKVLVPLPDSGLFLFRPCKTSLSPSSLAQGGQS